MKRIIALGALAFGLAGAVSPASADVIWYTSQLRQQECRDSSGQVPARLAVQSCTYVIRTQRGLVRLNAFRARGDRYAELREYERALADYDQVIRMRPLSATAHYRRSEANLALGRYDAAAADAGRVVELSPQSAAGHRMLCEVRALQGQDLDLARQECERALEVDPRDGRTLSARGLLNLRSGANEQAWSDFNQAIVNGWGDARTFYGRGLAALRAGGRDPASDFADAGRLQPDIAASFIELGVGGP